MANCTFSLGDSSHEALLFALWSSIYPNEPLDGLQSSQWCKIGFQSKGFCIFSLHFYIINSFISDPTKDFRGFSNFYFFNMYFDVNLGMGLLGPHCLLYLSTCYTTQAQQTISKYEQQHDDYHITFPWACAGINICSMLYNLLQVLFYFFPRHIQTYNS